MTDADYKSRSERRRDQSATRRGRTVAALVTAALVIGAGAWACNSRGGSDDAGGGEGGADKCAGSQITVVANPSLSGPLNKALAGYEGAKDQQGCPRTYSVQSTSDNDMVKQLAGGSPSAQIWVSDNPTSFDAASKATGASITPGTAFASTPAIVSGPADQLKKLGTNEASWANLVSAKPAVTVADVTRDRASALAVTAAAQAFGGDNEQSRKALGQLVLTARDTIPADAPHVTTEADLIARNAKSSPELAETGLEGGSPLVTVTAAKLMNGDAATDAAYKELTARLSSGPAQKAFSSAGYRSADGSTVPADAPAGSKTLRTIAAANDETVAQVISSWVEAAKPLRLTTVLDVSGSMAEKTNGVSRIEAVAMSLTEGLDSLPSSTSVSLWEFSTLRDGAKDYKELIPMGSVSDPMQRRQTEAALANLPNNVRGDTGLYDSIWASFQAAQKDYKPGQISTVLLVTDGRNDDPKGGLTLEQLEEKLKGAVDPKRPVDISTLAVGQDVDTKVLSDIATITGNGGKVYSAKTPQDVPAQLTASLSDRSGG